jgi:hypothetical protein
MADEASDPWPFDQPRNCATLTTVSVMRNGAPVVRVYHDDDDHGWQFHCEGVVLIENVMLVSLASVVALDPSLLEIADLEPGWMAQRPAPGHPWTRLPVPPDDDGAGRPGNC